MSKLVTNEMQEIIAKNIDWLKTGAAKEEDFQGRTIPMRAIESKRSGDLAQANREYQSLFRSGRPQQLNSDNIWGWIKICLLAKDWDGLVVLLHYHFTVMVAWNRLMRDKGNIDFFRGYEGTGITPYFDFDEFNAVTYLRERTHSSLLTVDEVTKRFASFGGSAYWDQNYQLTYEECVDFVRTLESF